MQHIKLRYENGLSAVYSDEGVRLEVPIRYHVYFNDKNLEIELVLDVDGYYHCIFTGEQNGFIDAWVLRTIAEMIDELNKPMDGIVENYFRNNNTENDTKLNQKSNRKLP